MAAPNIRSLTTVTAKTATLAVTTSATAILTNAASSGKLMKIVSLVVANVDGTNAADISADHVNDPGGTPAAFAIASTIEVAADKSQVLIDASTPIYLEENQALQLTASADNDLEAVCCYEEYS